MMKCEKCGTCCRYVFVEMKDDKMADEIIECVKYRGIRRFGKVIAIPCKCKHLTENNLCGIHSRKPKYCKDLYCWTHERSKELKILKEEL